MPFANCAFRRITAVPSSTTCSRLVWTNVDDTAPRPKIAFAAKKIRICMRIGIIHEVVVAVVAVVRQVQNRKGIIIMIIMWNAWRI